MGAARQRWDLGQEALPHSYCYVFVDRGVMQMWVRWMLCQRRGALPSVGREPVEKKKKNEATNCGLKMKARVSHLLQIRAVVGIGIPFFDPKGEGMAQK